MIVIDLVVLAGGGMIAAGLAALVFVTWWPE